MAVPQLIAPPAARPATVTIAGRLLITLAIGAGAEALATVAATVRVGSASVDAFADIAGGAGGHVVDALMFGVVTYAFAAAIAGILAGVNLRGSRAGRVWTWLLAVPTLLFVLHALGSPNAATRAATPQGADLDRPRVVHALAVVRASIPPWYVGFTHLFDVVAAVILVAVIVLVAVPASSAYFRAHHRRRRSG
jgi:hypothetical protein